ncbi:hypothetical protein [Saccharibacillus sp. JS10]|uniref:hypothetical protein n=1 Tax=Saccharibacillus sp. JS10 TaxID=2950552 RepID=UPI00210AEF64|nr:hypothetical protein [Saccharibacillus sp. JS10]MCQ4088665.1 hypothetical protein [Saccharibacillus sp. JS10]
MFEIFGGDLPVSHQTVSEFRKTDRRLSAQTNSWMQSHKACRAEVEAAKAYVAEKGQIVAFGA